MRVLSYLIALVTGATLSLSQAFAVEMMMPDEAYAKVEKGEIVLVDIRTPQEWAETGVPEPAKVIDMTSANFVPDLKQVMADNPGKPIAFICRTANRSTYLVAELEKYGLKDIYSVEGGIAGNAKDKGWIADGLPMRKQP